MPVKSRLEREPWRAVYDDPRWTMTLREARIRDGDQCRALLKDGVRCPEVSGLEGHHRIPLRELWARGEGARAFDSRIVIMLCTAHHHQAEAAADRSSIPPSPQTHDADDDDENVGLQSYESITTIPRWRIDNLLDAGFAPEHVQRIIAEDLDWRLALTLVESGCSHDTALRIA